MSYYQPQKDIEQQQQGQHTVDDLTQLFKLDSITDGRSMAKIKQWGGDQALAHQLSSNLIKGLDSEAAVVKSREVYGRNVLIEKPLTTLWELISECFEDTMLRILMVAAFVSTFIGVLEDGIATGWTEGATIFLAIFLIVFITAGNNYVKQRQFQSLQRKLSEGKVQVVRGGVTEISITDVVVGDILIFNLGDQFQVDGMMIQGSSVKIDESAMTGESDEIKKQPYNELANQQNNLLQTDKTRGTLSPFLLSGTKCLDGSGQMIILAVGTNTVIGQLKDLLNTENPPTPLQQKLETVAQEIGKVGMIVAAFTFLALMGHLGYNCYTGKVVFASLRTVQIIVEAFMTAVTIIVVAVPEGLPLAVTIALAYSVDKMKTQQNLVKTLASCEIMGGANNICSDKTGTLTQNIMQVVALWTENLEIKDNIIQNKNKIKTSSLEILCEGIMYNSNAFPQKDKVTNKFTQIGNKTECALIELADAFGFTLENFRPSQEVLRQIPFNSKRKKMSTAVYNKKTQYIRVYSKGASEVLLQQCTKYIANNGVEQILDQNKKNQILQTVIEKFAGESLRTIGLAYKDLDPQSQQSNVRGSIPNLKSYAFSIPEDDLDKDMTLVAIAGIKDPIRPDVPAAIEQCKKSGVTVRMVTGDNKTTASAIARECGIIQGQQQTQYEVLEGKTFREFVGGLKTVKDQNGNDIKVVGNAENFSKVAKELRVMARASPEDKFILVTGLIAEGNVVAVTGDGTNDAPALKKADVGFAMGITGSDVSKDAADIILMDDNFSSIITAMKWGRNIYDCIRKFIQFQLTVNLVALFMSFLGAVVLTQSPLNAIQMLWVNLIMDTFASLALATEPPTLKVLDRKPYKRDDQIISPTMYRTICGASIYQIIILVFILFQLPNYMDIQEPSLEVQKANGFKSNTLLLSIFFQAFVIMQVFNSVTCRQLDYHTINPFANLCINPLFWFVQGFTLIIQFLVVQYGGRFVKVMPLNTQQHLFCLALGAFSIIFQILVKFIPESFCQSVRLFRETEMSVDQMDESLTSKLRRKSTMRLQTSQKKSFEGGSLMRIGSNKQ